MKSLLLLFILPAVAYGAFVFGGSDTATACAEALSNGTVRNNVPDPDDCSEYYLCSVFFQSKMACRFGQHFSASEQKCTDPCKAQCDKTLTCSTTTTSTTTAAAATAAAATAAATATSEPEESTEALASSSSSVAEGADTSTDVSSTDLSSANASSKGELYQAPTVTEVVTDDETDAPTDDSSADKVETSTTFLEGILKRFNKPPSSIPGASGPTSV